MRHASHAQRCIVLVACAAIGGALFVGSGLLAEGGYRPWGLAGLALFAWAWLMARIATRDVAERRAGEVDEYEFLARADVRSVGYVLALAALIGGFVLTAAAGRMADGGDLSLVRRCPPLLLAGYLIAAACPTFLLLWRTRRTHENDDRGDA